MRNIRKIISLVLVIMVLSSVLVTDVFAASLTMNPVSVSKSNVITLSGKVTPNAKSRITITVYKPNSNNIDYIDQMYTNENGEFTLTYLHSGAAPLDGDYKIVIGGTGIAKVDQKVIYFNYFSDELLDSINSATMETIGSILQADGIAKKLGLLYYEEYKALSNKASVHAALVNKGFTNITDVRTAFDSAVNRLIGPVSEDIEVGDYVQLGKLYDEPILWRVVSKDTNGLLLLSDRIVSVKAYSASYDTPTVRDDLYRQTHGSNYWGTSSLRDWLNSDANTVTYTSATPDNNHVLDGYNDYANESGFLAGFNQNEKALINPVTHNTVLSFIDCGIRDGGTEVLDQIGNISDIKNYNRAFYDDSTDKVFILDAKQMNQYVHGNNYSSLKRPTVAAITESEWKTGLDINTPYRYWVRTPQGDNSSNVLTMEADSGSGFVNMHQAFNGTVGVVPAMYIKETSKPKSGNGSERIPYILDTADYSIKVNSVEKTANNTIKGAVSLINNTGVSKTGIVYVAAYDEDGILVATKKVDKTVATTANFDVDLVSDNITKVRTVKAFFVNNETQFSPLAEDATFRINLE